MDNISLPTFMYVEKEKYLASRSPLLGEKGEVEERERKRICNLADVTKKTPNPTYIFRWIIPLFRIPDVVVAKYSKVLFSSNNY